MDRNVADPMIGRVLDGRYRVGSRIARGGMATVYEATDLRLDRVCALKVMHPGLGDDDEFAARFVREAHSAARLSHPNVVAVFDQGDDSGTLFLAMEYIPGHTLRDLIRKEAPMAPGKALALVDPILSALGAAHQAGMIHRDVKPENVLLADDGRIKVADFGLARAVSADTQHTATGGVLIGTVSYLSPELVVDGKADARSDVYAVGVLIYEMLTGRKPHEGDSPIQVAYKHVHEDVPPPSAEIPSIPAYVDALVARATARDRRLRPTDARVLLHQVRRVRDALDHGVTDDPDLTEDLTPTGPVFGSDSIDYISEDAPTIVSTAGAARALASDREHTSIIGAPTSDGPATPRRPSKPQRPEQRPARRRSRRGPILLLVVLLLATGAGVAGWYFGMGRYTAAPGVINLSSNQARDKVETVGLTFEIGGREFSETVAAGSVIRTHPAAGARISKDGTVSAVVSRGAERHGVPKVRGSTLAAAKAELARQNLTFGRASERYHETVPAGIVLSSDPRPGKEVKRDTAVNLVVSSGPRPIKVPDFTGKDADDAEKVLTKRGFEVEQSEENSDTVDEGLVITQTPSSGTLFDEDVVKLVVSEGPVMVEVPNVRGNGVAEATDKMEALGFRVRTEQAQIYLGLGYVADTSPGRGAMARKGSTITLFLV